jgi:hypothetical protein
MLHTSLQLEVAALACSLGADVEFETPTRLLATSRPAGIVISAKDMPLTAECFCIYSDQE